MSIFHGAPVYTHLRRIIDCHTSYQLQVSQIVCTIADMLNLITETGTGRETCAFLLYLQTFLK